MKNVADEQVWETIRSDALRDATHERALAGFLHNSILRHASLAESLSHLLSAKLENPAVSAMVLRDLVREAIDADPNIVLSATADLHAIVTRDPACRGYSDPLLYYKGFHAVQSYRVANHYWLNGRQPLALYLQNRISEVFAVDIHPGARIGKGVMFDHATSVVIGETAVIEDDFSMLHEVTLGGTGKEGGDRHPKIGRGVMIGAGAKILGNIKVGEGAKIGAGSVVLSEVPPHTTVAGVPARPVSFPASAFPALDMDQSFGTGDLLDGFSEEAWARLAESRPTDG
ncbi:MAG: serine O-acetyltransferase [Dermatophilus congolensis]|nr:serine O-acetyltransferase [Dermatophilus congolensis]